MIAWGLLVLTLAALVWFQRNDVKNFAAFALIDDTRRRQRIFLRWAAQSCAFYLGVPLTGLALIGRFDALWHFPPEFEALAAPLPILDMDLLGPFLLGAGIGLTIVVLAFAIRSRLPRKAKAPAKSAPLKIAPLFPRNRAEALHLVPLVVNAGVSEEVFSRLYLPLLMVAGGLDPLIAFIATTAIFGLLHRYQGWLGIVITSVLGGIFAFAYLAGGGLWLPVLLHLVINANSLLLRPAIKHLTAPRGD